MIRRTPDRTQEQISAWAERLDGAPEAHSAGTSLYTPGDAARDLFVLKAGKVGLFLRSDEGRALTIKMVEPGQIFGHVALSDAHYDAYADALSDVRIQRVDRDMARATIEQDPALGLVLLEELGRYRKVVSDRLDEVAFKSVPARLASVLLELANRHGSQVPRHSHRQLAEMINAYRETVTKVINQFRAAHLLEIDTSSITLLNLRRLEELAQS
jgi:CRP/FNR family transcriptional regulator, cyclic AMP receptor protein